MNTTPLSMAAVSNVTASRPQPDGPSEDAAFGAVFSLALSQRQHTGRESGPAEQPPQPAAEGGGGVEAATSAAAGAEPDVQQEISRQQSGDRDEPQMPPGDLLAIFTSLANPDRHASHSPPAGDLERASGPQRLLRLGARDADILVPGSAGHEPVAGAVQALAMDGETDVSSALHHPVQPEGNSSMPPSPDIALTADGNAQPVLLATLQQTGSGSPELSLPDPGMHRGLLTQRVGTESWNQALGQSIVWMTGAAEHTASLMLHPAELGPLQVVLNVSGAQTNATFITAQPEVRQAIEAALPKLREMLGDAGIQLGQASVNSGTPGRDGRFRHHEPHGLGRNNMASNLHAGQTALHAAGVPLASGRNSLVDTFA